MKVVRSATPGDAGADPLEQTIVGLPRARPLHPLQHVVRRVLQRQVDVLADLVALRHRVERRVVDRRRVEVEQADPLEAVDRVQLAEQTAERAALLAVDAVEGSVLRDEQQLLDAARCERARLVDDRIRRAAAVRAAQRRDDAERALVVAAFGDLHVRVVTRRREHARRARVVDVCGTGVAGIRDSGFGIRERRIGIRSRRFAGPDEMERSRHERPVDRADDLRHLARAQHGVDLRDLFLQLVPIALRHAAGDDQPLARAVLLVSAPSRGWCRSIPVSPSR